MPDYTHAPEPLGVPTRRAALRLLDAVLRRGESLESALPAATRAIHGPDRGLAHAIAAETLRRLPDLDAMIDSVTKTNLPDDAKARMALRIALVQVLILGTPSHAAISTVLPLVDGGPRKLVHGVFGTLFRANMLLPEVPTLPAPVELRWEAAWGEEMVDAAGRAIAQVPPLDLTIADPSETEGWREKLGGESLMPGHLRLGDHDSVPDMAGFGDGAWWVQDIAASLPARLLGKGEGHVLDLCAAPGGKTLQLAATGADIVALDRSDTRLKRLRANLERTHLSAEVVVTPAEDWEDDRRFDAVLLDAPCTATGTFRRNPEVLRATKPADVAKLADVQHRLLDAAAERVKPGGRLVYCVCSLEREEGETQIIAFLRRNPAFRTVKADPAAIGAPAEALTPEGWLRILPSMWAEKGGVDGFFAAKLERVS